MVLLLLTCCLSLLPLWESVIVLFCVLLYVTLCRFYFCNHPDGEKRACCFAKIVYLVSRDGCVALPRGVIGCLRFVIVVFPDHTHLLFSMHLTDEFSTFGSVVVKLE